jgi:serine/threonine protein kinase
MDIWIGQQVGNYAISQLLGSGGYANVYLGRNIHANNMVVAVKILQGGFGREDARKFLNEAQTLADLKHPHIIRIRDYGTIEEQVPYLIMDYAPHGTLRQKHRSGSQVPLPVVVRYTTQIADALQYAHNQGKIHRDVKPENMLLETSDRILLSDFGLVETAQKSMSLTQSNKAVMMNKAAGTPLYMPPEQFSGRFKPESDQYALAIVIYEWIAGHPPFRGSYTALEYQHREKFPPPLSAKNIEVPPAVEEVIMKALVKKPQQRFTSVQIFAEALEKAVQHGQKSRFGGIVWEGAGLIDEEFISTVKKNPAIPLPPPQTQTHPGIPKLPDAHFPFAPGSSYMTSQMPIEPSQSTPITQRQSMRTHRFLQDAIDTQSSIAGSQDTGEVDDNWLHFRWFILGSAIATILLLAIGFLFQSTTISLFGLIPGAIYLILGSIEASHYNQWYWFAGFYILGPLAGIFYSMNPPVRRPHRPQNVKQQVITLSFLGYAFFVGALIVNSTIVAYPILYISITCILSAWLIRLIHRFRLGGLKEEEMVIFFFPLSAPFASLVGLSKLDNHLHPLDQEEDQE